MNGDELHDLLRRYLLNTASERERAEVDRLLAERQDVRDALEIERQRLAVLDLLPAQEPSRDNVAVVDARITQEAARPRRAAFRWQFAAPIAAVAIIAVIMVLPMFSRAREAARRTTSQNNLKQFGLVMKMYSSECGEYPPLAPYDGVWMANLRCLIPEYISDVSIFFNPAAPDAEELAEEMTALLAREPIDWERVHRIAAQHYVYPGWVVHSADELPEFVQGVRRLARSEYGDDFVTGKREFLRPREGIERFLITDINNPAASAAAQSTIPIMFEHIQESRSGPAGINVLYMDGSVRFVRIAEEFPAVPETQHAFPPPPLEKATEVNGG